MGDSLTSSYGLSLVISPGGRQSDGTDKTTITDLTDVTQTEMFLDEIFFIHVTFSCVWQLPSLLSGILSDISLEIIATGDQMTHTCTLTAIIDFSEFEQC